MTRQRRTLNESRPVVHGNILNTMGRSFQNNDHLPDHGIIFPLYSHDNGRIPDNDNSNNPTLESLGIIICQTMHVHFAPRGQKRMARGNSHGGKAPKPPRRLRRNWEELESERLGSQIGDKGFASPVFLSISGNIRMLG